MIAYIRGILDEIDGNMVVLETSGGVAYEIAVMASDLERLPEMKTEMKLYTYFQVKEDGVALFGFLKKSELNLFKQLITVNGIGPKMGHSILSSVGEQELRYAILSEDAVRLSKAPGVGKKTAERLIIELKDKVKAEDLLSELVSEQPVKKNNGESEEQLKLRQAAVEILIALGYKPKEAQTAAYAVVLEEEMTEEDIVRLSLRQIG